MSSAPDDRPTTERPTEGGSLTTRQLGGYVLIAALILALVRFLRGSRARRG
ncbi:MAG TPA: hypothetical protein VFR14_00170 [Candidatus Limnocylindrales bacterium]|nr:hypothetical protein [Candidatus Limnocylindrales bacterium]